MPAPGDSPSLEKAAPLFCDSKQPVLSAVFCPTAAEATGGTFLSESISGMEGLLRVDCIRCGKVIRPGAKSFAGRPLASICETCSTHEGRYPPANQNRKRPRVMSQDTRKSQRASFLEPVRPL